MSTLGAILLHELAALNDYHALVVLAYALSPEVVAGAVGDGCVSLDALHGCVVVAGVQSQINFSITIICFPPLCLGLSYLRLGYQCVCLACRQIKRYQLSIRNGGQTVYERLHGE